MKPEPSDWKCNQGRGARHDEPEERMPPGCGIVMAVIMGLACALIGYILNEWVFGRIPR